MHDINMHGGGVEITHTSAEVFGVSVVLIRPAVSTGYFT
jgi:hypothetical protein